MTIKCRDQKMYPFRLKNVEELKGYSMREGESVQLWEEV